MRLELKGNAEILMEKLGLRQDIEKINRKMDEIVEGMEVCGRREVSRMVNDTAVSYTHLTLPTILLV